MDLHLLWFVLLGVLLTGYAILDGFDLGVGILHLRARGDTERRLFLNSIGPLWDGNEVWLVTFGGALFAAFPNAYAAAFSGFYLAFMLLLFALISRAVSIEFRSKFESQAARGFFDFMFFLASALATLLFGVAVGNCIRGIPIDARMEYVGGFWNLLGIENGRLVTLYPVLVGLFTISLFAMHGAIYLYMKTEGDLQKRIHGWMWTTFGVFLVMYVFTTIYTLADVPIAIRNFRDHPWAWLVVFLNVLAIANIPRAIHRGKPGAAFLSSCCCIAAFVFLFGVALYPYMIVSNLNPPAGMTYNPELSLTITNAASSPKTLAIMRTIAFLGMPFVLAYTAVIYWTFRGKVQLGKFSY